MAKTQFDLIPVRKAEIEMGKPLPWAVYDSEHHLLLNRGLVVTTEHQIEVLSEKGLFREGAAKPVMLSFSDSTAEAQERGPRRQEEAGTLDEVKLVPGDMLQLQPMVGAQSDRYAVRVIGVMKGKSVLVTAPVIDGKLIFVREAQPFLVRAFSGLIVCAFKSKVLKAQLTPFPYLHLAYPESVQITRIRKAVRARVQIISAILDRAEGNHLGAGRIVDLSVGGARIHTHCACGGVGQEITLAFKVCFDDIEEYLSVRAHIRSLGEETNDEGEKVKVLGVQFDQLAAAHRLIIMNVVYQYLLREID